MHRVDYVIVGGGVYGCGVAWHLARAGHEVVVLEAATVASGASGGIGRRGVRASGRDPRELPLMRRAHEIWPTLHDELGAPTGFEPIGHVQLVEREEDLPAAREGVRRQRDAGIPTELVDRDRLRSLEPEVAESTIGAVLCPGDGVADHAATTRAFADAAVRAGASVREGRRVTAVHRDGGRITSVVLADGEEMTPGRGVVLLANTGVDALLEPLGVSLPLFPVLPQALVTEPFADVPVRHVIAHAHRPTTMKPLPESTVMITGEWLGRWDEDGRPGTDPGTVEAALDDAAEVFPPLRGVRVVEARADRAEAIAHDLVPIVDTVPGADNAWFATGWSGHGWAIAPAVVEVLADWVTTGEPPEVLRPFSLSRFG